MKSSLYKLFSPLLVSSLPFLVHAQQQGEVANFGAEPGQWQFSTDKHDWRGTAFVEGPNGWNVALGCTRPGAEPAIYPGGSHVRPHEPGVYNFFVSPVALGADFGAPGAQTFTMAFEVDQQSFGTAPMIVLSPELSLATNIPVNHPMIAAMQSGSSLQVVSQSNGASISAPLRGSANAILALSSFCASPITLEQNLAQSNEQRQDNQTGPQPSGPTLNVAESFARGEQIIVEFFDPAPGSRPWITIVEEGSPGAAYGQYHYTNGQTSGDFAFSALQAGSYEVRFHTSETSTVPASTAKITVGPAIGAAIAQQGQAAQATGVTSSAELVCEVRREDERTAQYICNASDGGRLTNDQYRSAYAQIALRSLGCNVPEINGDISTSQDAMECFRGLLKPPEGRLEVTQLSDLSHHHKHKQKEDLIAALVAWGYTVAEEQAPVVAIASLPLDETPPVRATLDLPEPLSGLYYVSPGYYYSDFSVPLSKSSVFDLNSDTSGARNGKLTLGYARWLSEHIRFVAPLFDAKPSEAYSEGNAEFRTWFNELYCSIAPTYCTPTDAEIFPPEVLSALSAQARVLVCEYDRTGGTSTRPDLNAGGGSEWIAPRLTFWAQPMPVSLSAEKLKNFSGSNTGMHPLLAIGPYLESCPKNLGEAAEYLAGRLPELVPLAVTQPAVGTGQSAETSASVNVEQELAKQLLGLTLSETTVEPDGNDYGRNLLVISSIAENGPAFKSGLRTGDYVSAIGWTQPERISEFVRELGRSSDNGAVVLGVRIPGAPVIEGARLLSFPQEEVGAFRDIPRNTQDTERPGWTTLAEDQFGLSVSVQGDPWCSETVHGEYALPLDASQLMTTTSDTFANGYQAIQSLCPEVQKARLTTKSTLLDAPINVIEIDYSSGMARFERLGIDGLPPASTVTEAREIAAANAPVCDRLTAHPADPNRRFGLEGAEFILPDTLEQAVTACLEELEKSPEVPVVNFQLGRALYDAGLFEDAAGFFEVAAASGHGGAADYLGQMHADGNGVVQNFDLSDSYFAQAQETGFDPFAEPEKVTFDTTGVTVPWTVQYLYEMSYRLMPHLSTVDGYAAQTEYKPDTLRYFFHITKEIAESCTDEGTLNRLYEELEKGGADVDQLEHAIFMYESYLPNLLPIMAQRVNQTMDDFQEGGSKSGFALTGRYECQSVQLRQLALNAATLIVR